MQGEQSVNSDEASEFRRILEASPHTYTSYSPPTDASDANSHAQGDTTNPADPTSPGQESRATQTREPRAVMTKDRRRRHRSRGLRETDSSRQLDQLSPTQLQVLLTRADERLTSESKRAALAETRAHDAEARVIALLKEVLTVKQEVSTEKAKRAAYEVQVGQARAEILRAQEQIDAMARSKHQAEEEAARERGHARQMRHEMDIQRAVEAGRREGYAHGWAEGNKDGRRRALRQAQALGYVDPLPPEPSSQYGPSMMGSTQIPEGTYPGPGAMPVPDIPPRTATRGPDVGPAIPDNPTPPQMPVPDVPPPNTGAAGYSPPSPEIIMPEPEPFIPPVIEPNNSPPPNPSTPNPRNETSPVANGRPHSRMSHRSRGTAPVEEPTPPPRPPSRQPSPVPVWRTSLLEPDPVPRPKSPRPDTGLNKSASRPASRISRHSIIENDIPVADGNGTFSLPPPHAMTSGSTPRVLSPKPAPRQQPGATGLSSAVPPVTISVQPPITIAVQPPSNEVSASGSHLELLASPASSVSSASDLPVPVPPPKSPRTKGPPSANKGRRVKRGIHDPNKKRQAGDSGSEKSWDFMLDFAGGGREPSDTENPGNALRMHTPLSIIPERPLSEASRPPSHSPAAPYPAQFDPDDVTQPFNAPASRPLSRAASQPLRDSVSRSPFGSAPQMYENVPRPPSRTAHVDIPRATSPIRDNPPREDPGFMFNPHVEENGAPQNGQDRIFDLSAIDDSRARNNTSAMSGSSRHTQRHHRVIPIMPARLGGDGLALPPRQRARPSQEVEFLEKQVRSSESVTSGRDDERSVTGRHHSRPASMNNMAMPSISVHSGTPPEATTSMPDRRHSMHTSPHIRSRSPFQTVPSHHLLSPSAGARPIIDEPPPVIEPAFTPPEEHTDYFAQQNEHDQTSGFPSGFVPSNPPNVPGALGRTPARGGLPAITPARVPLPVSAVTPARNLPAEGSHKYSYEAAPPGAVPGDVLPRQTPHEGRRKPLAADNLGQPGKTPFSRTQQLGDNFAGNYAAGHTPGTSSRIPGATPAAGRSKLPVSGQAATYSIGAPLEPDSVVEGAVLPPSWPAPATGRAAAYSALNMKTPGVAPRAMHRAPGYAPAPESAYGRTPAYPSAAFQGGDPSSAPAPGSAYGRTPAYPSAAFQGGDPGSVQLAAGVALPGSSRAPTLALGKTPAKSQRRLSAGFASSYNPGAPLPRQEGTPAHALRQLPPSNNAASYDVGVPVPMGTPVFRSRRSSDSGLYTGSPIIPDMSLRGGGKSHHTTPANRQASLYERMVEEIPEEGF